MFAGTSMLTPQSQNTFPQELLLQMPPYLYGGTGNMYHQQQQQQNLTPHHQYQQFPDYGLLQDIIPPHVFPKQEQ